MVTIILSINKCNFSDIDLSEKLIVIVTAFLIELSLMIWGSIELFYKSNNCIDLKNSNLWKFGLATFIIQLIFCSLFIISFGLMYFINHISNNESTEKNTIRSNSNKTTSV